MLKKCNFFSNKKLLVYNYDNSTITNYNNLISYLKKMPMLKVNLLFIEVILKI